MVEHFSYNYAGLYFVQLLGVVVNLSSISLTLSSISLGARVSVSDGTVTIVAKTQEIMDKAIEKVQVPMTPIHESLSSNCLMYT